MASPPPENGTGETVVREPITPVHALRAKKSEDRTDMIDDDESVKSGVSHWRKVSMQGQTANGDKHSLITLMELARDGPFDDFETAWGLKDPNGNSGESSVNLNTAVAVTGVNFEAQRKALEKLYTEQDIQNILSNVEWIERLYEDRNRRKENIEANGVGTDERHRPDLKWNACAAIYPGRTALHMAAANGQVEIVNAICKASSKAAEAKDVFGYTPLHLACYSGHPNSDEVVTKLLTKTVDANAAAKLEGFYFTALHLAVKAKSKDIVDMLLDWNGQNRYHGRVLDVGAKSDSGLTALHLAVKEAIAVKKALEVKEEALKVEKEKLEVERVEFEPTKYKLLKERARLVMIIKAIIRFMNNKSPEAINKSDNNKSTPLHTSIEANDYELVEILLEDGDKIDPELLDAKARTALEIAVHQGDYPMVQKIQRYLERAGLFGDHQAYADSANAILVGAALLATVTFTAWVQIPTNDSTLFWVFISFSFYFAIATFIAAAGAAIPSRGSTLGLVRRAVLASAICLEISLGCAVAAFATAGFLILPPGKPHRKVIATTAIGGFVCFFFLLSFLRKITRALDPIFLWLDYKIQSQIKDRIWKPVTKGVTSRLEHIALVKRLTIWYNKNVMDPDPKPNSRDDDYSTTSFPHDRSTGSSRNKKSEGSSGMGKRSGRTGSTSSMEDGSKTIIIETEA